MTSKNPNRQPAIQYGPPGRSAISGQVATVFGCTGFLGRYLVAKLGACLRLNAYILPSRAVFECTLICFCVLFFSRLVWLAKAGTQVIVPFRDEDEKRHLKVMGDLGQIVPMVRSVPRLRGHPTRLIVVCSPFRVPQEWDLRNEEQTSECLRHSNVVYNLVGRNYETKYLRSHPFGYEA